ncbi:MAG: hypothetical protein A2157_13685 [Deltaproteobacteria bacterium RBG_16_47_11]|nr:MAG: hypothetical protein A2157_13685 [Deltaproteobacteria bacterium RBG_16_47_11]
MAIPDIGQGWGGCCAAAVSPLISILGFIFQAKLKQEIEVWLKEGVIDADQKEQLLERYRRLKKAAEKAGPGKLITYYSCINETIFQPGTSPCLS